MERGASGNAVFTFPESVDFAEIAAMRLHIYGAKSGIEIVREGGELTFIEGNMIGVNLSQEDTLSFEDNESLRLQWHWRNKDGTARVSRIIETRVYEFIGDGVI